MDIPISMYLYRKHIFRIIYFLILLFQLNILVEGQDRLRYMGSMRLGEYTGSADYQYNLVEGDTTFNGPFNLRTVKLNSLLDNTESYFSLDGSFKENLPDSTWHFQFGEFYREVGTELIDYHLKVKISGLQHSTLAPFKKGVPTGEWTHIVKKIDSSSVARTVFESKVPFDEGRPHGILLIKNDSLTLLGRFRSDGMAHDRWELNFSKKPNRLETWHFTHGRLKEIEIRTRKGIDTVKVFPEGKGSYTSTNLDQRYFRILALQNPYIKKALAEGEGDMESLISEHATYYKKVVSILSDLGELAEPATLPYFGVEVLHYPLDSVEKVQVRTIEAALQRFDTLSQQLISNTQLNILKHSDEEILFLLSAVKELHKNYLAPVREVIQYQQEGLLDFFPREYLGLKQTPPREILVSYQDSSGLKTRTFEGPTVSQAVVNPRGMTYLEELNRYAWVCLDSIDRKLRGNLRREALQQELEELERTLLSQEDELMEVLDSLKSDLPLPYIATLNSLKTSTNRELKAYAQEEDLNLKPVLARELIGCIEEMGDLAQILAKLPNRRDEIQQLYTEQVWNPFTVTTMKDQVKERIFQAYDELLIPSILKQIETELTCANTEKFRSTLNSLYERMQQLRKQNTSKLERKLKKEDDPRIVMELFEISM